MFKTPILFIVFNRPVTTIKVFEEIKAIKPLYLYIAADGPRNDRQNDLENCQKVKEIISQIDWHCEIKTKFNEFNLGCGLAVSSAITWFFNHVDNGIILEDDCVPHKDFFYFCEEMLYRYESNINITSIAGSCFQKHTNLKDYSYYFSVHNKIWGWATWKRTWDYYDLKLSNITSDEFHKMIMSNFKQKKERKYWLKVFETTKAGLIDTWDFQFMFLQWKLNGLTITPNVNLIKNIGFDNDATHTRWGAKNINFTRETHPILPLKHPLVIQRDIKADEYYFKKYIQHKPRIIVKIIRNINKIKDKCNQFFK